MLSSAQGHPESPTQLALDFSAKPKRALRSPITSRVVQHAPRIVASKVPVPDAREIAAGVIFHADASHISSDQFAMKFSLHGRSYLVEGGYRITSERSHSDGESSSAIGNVRIAALFTYRNGRYASIPVSTQEYTRFERLIFSVLRNPYYNTAIVP